jgi:hypothetical protein
MRNRIDIPERLEKDAEKCRDVQDLFQDAVALYKIGNVHGYRDKLEELADKGIDVSEYVPGIFELGFPRLTHWINHIPDPKDLAPSEATLRRVIYGILLFPVKRLTYLGMRAVLETEYIRSKAAAEYSINQRFIQ